MLFQASPPLQKVSQVISRLWNVAEKRRKGKNGQGRREGWLYKWEQTERVTVRGRLGSKNLEHLFEPVGVPAGWAEVYTIKTIQIVSCQVANRRKIQITDFQMLSDDCLIALALTVLFYVAYPTHLALKQGQHKSYKLSSKTLWLGSFLAPSGKRGKGGEGKGKEKWNSYRLICESLAPPVGQLRRLSGIPHPLVMFLSDIH